MLISLCYESGGVELLVATIQQLYLFSDEKQFLSWPRREFATSIMHKLLSPAMDKHLAATVKSKMLDLHVIPLLASALQPKFSEGEEQEAIVGVLSSWHCHIHQQCLPHCLCFLPNACPTS